jgi:SAM-dependent methyltransferase
MKIDKVQDVDIDEIMEKIRKEITGKLSIGDFTKYHDEQFIKNAYRVILEREPDQAGAHDFLRRLRLGELSKTRILEQLRYSEEGRSKRVKIRGLLPRAVIDAFFRIPVVGYLARFLYLLVRFPRLFEYVRMFEALKELRQADVRKIEELRESYDAFSVKTLETLAETRTAVQDSVGTLARQINDQKLTILAEQRRVTILLDEARKRLPQPFSARQLETILTEEEHVLDAMYLTFEDKFRGSREDIKERLKTYLPYIEHAVEKNKNAPLLDIGCGRGEWLELLKGKGYKAQGIDLNRVMIRQCTDLGLDVREAEVISFLRKQDANTFGAITGFHIIEHLPLKSLVNLFDEALRVLAPGGLVIFETPNPENIIVGSCNFYIDPTHRNPLPPDPVKFIAEQRGFARAEILRLHKYKEMEPTGRELIDDVIRRFTMEQDYSVIGYKE